MTAVEPARPLRPLAAVGWAALFLLGGFALFVLLAAGGFALAGITLVMGQQPSPGSMMIQSLAGLVAFGSMTWLIGRRALHLSWADLRWTGTTGAAPGFVRGLAVGAVPAALALLLAMPIAGARIVGDTGGFGAYLSQMALTLGILLPAALLEEVMFRGVAQVVLARRFGRVPAVIALSLLFALAHITNPDVTGLALVNIGLAGVFLGLAFYTPGGMWTAWGAHLGWNATLAGFDAPVSGLPFPIPMINYLPGKPDWLTGGAFGPEGGMLASIMVLLAIAAIRQWLTHSKEQV